MKVISHPRYSALHQALREHEDQFIAWKGDGFRFQTVSYPTPEEILSGTGSLRFGGRWNAPGAYPVVYASTTEETALAESKAHDRYYGVVTKSPRLIVAIHVRLDRILDLTSASVRRKLDLTLVELKAEDWRKVQQAGKESLTQAIGRAAHACAVEGLLLPSAEARGGVNLAIFPRNLRPGSEFSLWEREKLDEFAGRRDIS